MNRKMIEEMWEMSEGGNAPKDFIATCESYYKHKCVFAPHPFTESDFAACVMNYKLAKSVQRTKKEILNRISKDGEDAGGGGSQNAEEPENV